MIVLSGYIISYISHRYNHYLTPWWIINGAAGLSFFTLGYAFRDNDNKWLRLLGLIVYFICCFIGFPVVDMLDNSLRSGNYLLWIPITFCCILAFNFLCKLLYKYSSHQILKLLSFIEWIGNNAMPFYVTHFIIVEIVSFFLNHYCNIISLWRFVIIIIAYLILLPCCYKLLNSKMYNRIMNL